MGLNDLLLLCRHLLVPFLVFHAVTSLHPLSFQKNYFSACLTHYSVWSKAIDSWGMGVASLLLLVSLTLMQGGYKASQGLAYEDWR